MSRRLVVLAGDEPAADRAVNDAPDRETWVLPLAAGGEVATASHAEVAAAADAAAARVRTEFPDFLWRWIRAHGALDLASWHGVSWWWYTPLSEKSPLRSPIVNELYRLTLLQELLARERFDRIEWHGGDATVAAAAETLTRAAAVDFESFGSTPAGSGPLRLAARRWLYFVYSVARRAFVRMLRLGGVADQGADALLFTRMPVLWERQDSSWRERMFGDWPEHLEARGHRVAYAAVVSAGPGELWRRRHEFADLIRSRNVVVLDRLLRLRDVGCAHVTARFLIRYARWRRAQRMHAVMFNGLDIGDLFWREMDASALSTEIPLDLSIVRAMRRLAAQMPALRAVFLPFEYQPMERAVWAGATADRAIPVVGLQTGLYTSNQMGFAFPGQEARSDTEPKGAPLPDVIAAYGELPYRVFAERLGHERVCLSGPVRYPDTVRRAGEERTESAVGVPADTTLLLVPTPIARDEATALLRAAFNLAARRPELFVLLKFHYHLPLGREVEKLARELSISRYDVVETEISKLLAAAPMTVCGGSSVGVEALACGSMPLVYRPVGHLSANPLLDVPEAAFFWDTVQALDHAVDACERRDEQFQARVDARGDALRKLLFPLDGRADERLYTFLQEHRIL